MGYKFNPFTGNLDTTDSPNGVFEAIEVNGDVTLDDGGSFTTTLQTITPTANRTVSLPNATGTVALVAGSSGQVVWNNAGANAGASTLTYDGSILTTSGRFINSYNATASAPAKAFTGTWFTGGTSTTTKPQVLIEPAGTTSTAWSTSGTGLGVNAATGFTGRLLDLQVNGTSRAVVTGAGNVGIGTASPAHSLDVVGAGSQAIRVKTNDTSGPLVGRLIAEFTGGGGGAPSNVELRAGDGYTYLATTTNTPLLIGTNALERARIDSSGRLLVGTSSTSSNATVVLQGRSDSATEAATLRLARGINNPPTDTSLSAIAFTDSGHTNAALIAAIRDGGNWTSGSSQPTRLVFSTTADGASSPTERMRIKSNGTINFSNVAVYADNTAALAGGLVAGDVYRKSDGTLMITY